MDAGDADLEAVLVAGLDDERVLAVFALRVREASTRASGRVRADEATTEGDPGWTRETLTSSLFSLPDLTTSASSPNPPYARARSVDASVGPRARGRGDDGWGTRMDAGDADLDDVLGALDDDGIVAAFCLRVALRPRRARDVSDAGRSRRLRCCRP